MTFLYIVLFLWVFWYLYILAMGLYRAHLQGKLKWYVYVLAAPALVIAYTVDVVAQYTIASIYFLDLPRRNEHLVTDRLQRYMLLPENNIRRRKAKFICENLLDYFDPAGKHC